MSTQFTQFKKNTIEKEPLALDKQIGMTKNEYAKIIILLEKIIQIKKIQPDYTQNIALDSKLL